MPSRLAQIIDRAPAPEIQVRIRLPVVTAIVWGPSPRESREGVRSDLLNAHPRRPVHNPVHNPVNFLLTTL
jgi:hypothetical protein